MTHDEMIAVIAAHRDGKALEWRYAGTNNQWEPFTISTFNFVVSDYRVAPQKPQRCWGAKFVDGAWAFHPDRNVLTARVELLQEHIQPEPEVACVQFIELTHELEALARDAGLME